MYLFFLLAADVVATGRLNIKMGGIKLIGTRSLTTSQSATRLIRMRMEIGAPRIVLCTSQM